MNIRTIIAEDNPSQRTVIDMYANKLGLDVICTVSSGTRLVDETMKWKPDLLLLDISLSKLNGLDAYKQILELGLNPNVIIITGSLDSRHLITGYEYDSLDYIVKPITFDRFEKAINKAKRMIEAKLVLENLDERNHRLITLTHNYREFTVSEDQIFLIEKTPSSRNRTTVYLVNGEMIETTNQLSEIKENCSGKIVYSHRSYLINMTHIRSIQPDALISRNFIVNFNNQSKTAPLTKRYYKEFQESYESLININ